MWDFLDEDDETPKVKPKPVQRLSRDELLAAGKLTSTVGDLSDPLVQAKYASWPGCDKLPHEILLAVAQGRPRVVEITHTVFDQKTGQPTAINRTIFAEEVDAAAQLQAAKEAAPYFASKLGPKSEEGKSGGVEYVVTRRFVGKDD